MFARLSRVPSWAVLAALVALSTGLRAWGGSMVPAPWYTPDEQIYGDLGRSLWSSGKLAVLGTTSPFYSLVYPAFAGLPLSLSDRVLGYDLLKGVQACVMSLTAVPVYLWGRSLMRTPYALLAAALTLAVPGLAFSGFVMTEVAFYPVLTLAAWAAARALADPTPRRQTLFVGAVVLASLTRLQALALVPAFLLALGLDLVLGRRGLRAARPFVPGIAALLGLTSAWLVFQLARGGHPLGAYNVVGGAGGYSFGDVLAFAAYHAADLLWMLGVIPVVAVALLLAVALRPGEPDAATRAYLAVAASFSLVLVAEVGVFASRYVGRLAERNLLGLSPLLLLGFALWLERGAPRPRTATAGICLGALALFFALPVGRFVVEAAIPDAYTTAPFYRLHVRFPGLDLSLVVVGGAALVLLLVALVPRRLVLVLPAVAFLFLGAASISVTRVVAAQATAFEPEMSGDSLRWIDAAADGPVGVVYLDDPLWNRAWVNQFWNERVARVYDLTGKRVLGPMPQRQLVVAPDGRIGPKHAPTEPYALAPSSLTFAGRLVAQQTVPGLRLWKPEQPWRLTARLTSVGVFQAVAADFILDLYACDGGTLHVSAQAPGERDLVAGWNGRRVAALHLRPLEQHEFVQQAPPAGGSPQICRFTLSASNGVHLVGFRYEAPGRPPVGRTFGSL